MAKSINVPPPPLDVMVAPSGVTGIILAARAHADSATHSGLAFQTPRTRIGHVCPSSISCSPASLDTLTPLMPCLLSPRVR
eukprot:6964484-Alexandrium_andersonii.AAC.1